MSDIDLFTKKNPSTISMKCQIDPEMGSDDGVRNANPVDDPSLENSDDVSIDTGKQQAPDISLEWADMKVSFRIVSDFDYDQEHKNRYEIFPQFDPNSPSARTIPYMKRKANKEKFNGSTLTSFLGHMPPQSAPSTKFTSPTQSAPDISPAKVNPPSSNERRNSDLNYRRMSNVESIRHVQDSPDGPKKCHLCGKGFNKASYLKRHVLSHSSVKPYRCDICNWGFFQHCNLKRHMASHTLENGVAGFKCEHCSAHFTTKSVLSVHLRDAHGDKLLTKKEAQRTAAFDRAPFLTSGASNHVNMSQTMVMKGPKVSRGSFPPRILVGRGGKVARMGASPSSVAFSSRPPSSSPHKIQSPPSSNPLLGLSNISSSDRVSVNGWSRCNICNKSFLTPANLKQHMLLHPGSKPFRCNFCGMRFAQKINLKKHMVCHVSGNGHPCPHCNINFRTREDVTQHVLKQHPAGAISPGVPNSSFSASASAFRRQQEQRVRQRNVSNEQQVEQRPMKIEPNRPSNATQEGFCLNEQRINENEDGITNEVEEEEITDDEEEVEIPSPELPTSSTTSHDHFVIQGDAVTLSVPQMVGGALPHLPPLPHVSPSNKAVSVGSYTCSICMDSFDKVGLLNKHIIFKHSTGASISPTPNVPKVNK